MASNQFTKFALLPNDGGSPMALMIVWSAAESIMTKITALAIYWREGVASCQLGED